MLIRIFTFLLALCAVSTGALLAGAAQDQADARGMSNQRLKIEKTKSASAASVEATRKEFEKLDLRMMRTTTLDGAIVVILKSHGAREQLVCTERQVIGGFAIKSIKPDCTVFEGNGVLLWLPLGDEGLGASTSKRKGKGSAEKEQSVEIEVGSAPPGRFRMPVDGVLSSGFGYRQSPMGGATRYHEGVDIRAPMRSVVRSSAAGVVKDVSSSWAKGLNILIGHAGGYETAYYHLDQASVAEGDKVAAGEQIGLEGVTGITTGPHLHFEIHKDGQPVDPGLYLLALKN